MWLCRLQIKTAWPPVTAGSRCSATRTISAPAQPRGLSRKARRVPAPAPINARMEADNPESARTTNAASPTCILLCTRECHACPQLQYADHAALGSLISDRVASIHRRAG